MEIDFNAALLIHVGALFYIVAFLIRDEMKLRLLVLSGSVFYLLYYYLFPDFPLWDAILTTVILTLANLMVLFRIVLERSVFALSRTEKRLFEAFEGFTPGQFRQLLKIAQWHVAQSPTLLTAENQSLSKLYFIFEGRVEAKKGKHEFIVSAGNFIGEIAFVLKRAPTADVIAPQGTEYVGWDSIEIYRLMAKSSAFENAMMALLSRDLADKLATSIQPDSEIA